MLGKGDVYHFVHALFGCWFFLCHLVKQILHAASGKSLFYRFQYERSYVVRVFFPLVLQMRSSYWFGFTLCRFFGASLISKVLIFFGFELNKLCHEMTFRHRICSVFMSFFPTHGNIFIF